MRTRHLTAAIALTLASSLTLSSCIGSFALTNKVLTWNRQVGSKLVNEIVFFAFWVLPVYELSALADVLVINSIEFWSGTNPVVAQTQVIDGKDARYLVKTDSKGHTITNLSDKSVVRFNFDEADRSWSVEANGESHKIMAWVDDSHVRMVTPDGSWQTVELSRQGLFAYRQLVAGGVQYAMR